MPVEIEAKMRVQGLAPVREQLVRLGARRLGARLEENAFFDTAERTLLARDAGLRVRLHANDDGTREVVMTYKGPQGAGALKNREEIELVIDDLDAAATLLSRLGYSPTRSFQKRRESFELSGCRIELDELPDPLGTFVEIEGPDEPTVMALRASLGLGDCELIRTSYVAMVDRHLSGSSAARLAFSGTV